MSYVQRVASKAAELSPARTVLSVVAAPFYAVGFVLGVLWVLAAWVGAAVLTGIADARRSDSPAEDV